MPAHVRKVCASPECNRPQWKLGFCGQCAQRLRTERPDEFARLEAMSLEERRHANYLTKNNLPLPPWTYEPSPQQTEDLIRTYGQPERHHVKVGARARTEQENDHE